MVRGVGVDAQTRCAHYASALDIVAIQMKCCGTYYACKDCHEALADHAIGVWPKYEKDEQAVMCGACGAEMTIRMYLECGYLCPACRAPFNPNCREHHRHYFEIESNR